MLFNQIVETCQYLLNNYPEAQDCKKYLDERLTISSQEKFQFGYFPNLDNLTALTSILGEDILKQCKILDVREIGNSISSHGIKFLYFDNYQLIMPFKDPYGKIVALVGRSLLSDQERKFKNISKYKNTIFTKGNYVFGLFENKEEILKDDLVYVVEGQFDVIKSSEKGLNNIVALGNSSMTAYQFSMIKRYTNNIILLLDNDEAGEKGRKLIMDKFGTFANIQNFYLPEEYKDIDEFLSKNNYEDLSFIKN